MASWAITAQLTTGTLPLNMSGNDATDRIWLCGPVFGDPIDVGVFQGSIHISDGSDVERCTVDHVNNLVFSTDVDHYKLNGGTETAFSTTAPSQAECSFKFSFSDPSAVRTTGGLFFSHEESDEELPWPGVNYFYAFEKTASNVPAWDWCNSRTFALPLEDHSTPVTSHEFYVGICASPASNGEKAGKVKLKLTYV